MRKSEWLVSLVMVSALCLPVPSLAREMAVVDVGSTAVRWDLQEGDFEKVVLTVSLPDGNVIRREITGGQPVVFEVDAAAKDGVYIYELRGVPHRDAVRLPRETVQSGTFAVHAGSIVAPDLVEPRRRGAAAQTSGKGVQVLAEEQVINEDLIVRGRICVGGNDCSGSESFGDDVIRLKGEVLRIHFDDTSTTTGLPANDWRLIANDSGSGGANKFSIEDSTGTKTPFTITAGAPTNSIFVDSTGRVGFGTATPSNNLHVLSSGSGSDAGKVLIQNSSGTSAARELLEVRNANGAAQIVLEDGAQTPRWVMTGSNAWNLDNTANVGVELQVNPDGALLVNGTTMNVPDYVFDPSYELRPLSELAAFVREQRHLPNVPSAAEIKRDGLNLSKFPAQLLEKIEELALYTIEQHKQIEGLNHVVLDKKKEIAELQSRLAALEKVVQGLAHGKAMAEPER